MAALEMTRKEAKTMRENIKTTAQKYEKSKEQTADFLAQLTAKVLIILMYSEEFDSLKSSIVIGLEE